MRIVIWGTGKYYTKYSRLFQSEDIVCVIDSDDTKHGMEIDSFKICAPLILTEIDFDYVVILVKNCSEIIVRIKEQGISEDRIRTWQNFEDLVDSFPKLSGSNISLADYLDGKNLEKILVCSPNAERTGAPIAAMYLACALMKMGYLVVFALWGDGPLVKEADKRGLPCITEVDMFEELPGFRKCLCAFDYIFFNSVVMSESVEKLRDVDSKLFWWIHESDEKWYLNRRLLFAGNRITFLGAGPRVVGKFHELYPDYKIEEFLYTLPDAESDERTENAIRRFAVIGSLDYRKATDIVLDALNCLDKNERDQFEVVFVGMGQDSFAKQMIAQMEEIGNVTYIPALSMDEISKLYKTIDILICPSRDDPMPIVVTQAMQNGIPCIVSNCVGQSRYYSEYKCGAVFESENIIALSELISEYTHMDKFGLESKGREARRMFDDLFSENNMICRVKEVMSRI